MGRGVVARCGNLSACACMEGNTNQVCAFQHPRFVSPLRPLSQPSSRLQLTEGARGD